MKMMRRRILLILLVACGIAGGEEATYYLDADEGNDTTGDGSSGNPWATLTKAQATVVSGDTVKLYGGNYGAFAQTNPSYSSYVTYEAVDGDGDPPIFTSATVNRTTTLADVYLRFRDIWFDNGGLIVYRTRYLEVVDCNFVGAGYTLSDIPAASATNYAIRLENDCTLCTIQDCTITGDGAGQTRLIGGYSAGRVATVYPDWTTSPDATSIYQILPAARVDIQGWAGNLVTGDGDWADRTAYALSTMEGGNLQLFSNVLKVSPITTAKSYPYLDAFYAHCNAGTLYGMTISKSSDLLPVYRPQVMLINENFPDLAEDADTYLTGQGEGEYGYEYQMYTLGVYSLLFYNPVVLE